MEGDEVDNEGDNVKEEGVWEGVDEGEEVG